MSVSKLNLNPFTWLQEPTTDAQDGVILVHGLNNRPDTMNPIGSFLTKKGYAVIRCNLRGHYGNKFNASSRAWLEDIGATFTELKSKTKTKNIHAIGFSLGCTVLLNHLVNNQDETIKSLVLLAPAIKLRPQCKMGFIAKIIGNLPLALPAFTPPSHRAFKATSLRAYKGLYQLIENLNRPFALKALNQIPTSIIVDKRDKLVSAKDTAKLLSKESLSNWKLNYLNPTYGIYRHKHHLIIDNKCIDIKTWETLRAVITEHLSGTYR